MGSKYSGNIKPLIETDLHTDNPVFHKKAACIGSNKAVRCKAVLTSIQRRHRIVMTNLSVERCDYIASYIRRIRHNYVKAARDFSNQSLRMVSKREPRPFRAAFLAAVSSASVEMSLPIPSACGHSFRSARQIAPVPVPKSSIRALPLSATALFKAGRSVSTRISVSGRGSSVSLDRRRSRP